jgi:hypothetical protein
MRGRELRVESSTDSTHELEVVLGPKEPAGPVR